MKLRVISDLHAEYYHGSRYAKTNTVSPNINDLYEKLDTMYPEIAEDEILVLGGDIAVLYDKNNNIAPIYDRILEYFARRWKRIVYVPGNHEYYNLKGVESIPLANNVMKDKCQKLGIQFLQKDTVEIDDHIFVGCTLWSDLKYNDWMIMNPKNKKVFRYYKTYKEEFMNNLKWLKDKLVELRGQNVIVVTHYVPLYEIIHSKFVEGTESIGLSQQASDLSKIITENNLAPKYWICGHCHEFNSINKYGINFYLNPMGRYYESRVRPFRPEILEF